MLPPSITCKAGNVLYSKYIQYLHLGLARLSISPPITPPVILSRLVIVPGLSFPIPRLPHGFCPTPPAPRERPYPFPATRRSRPPLSRDTIVHSVQTPKLVWFQLLFQIQITLRKNEEEQEAKCLVHIHASFFCWPFVWLSHSLPVFLFWPQTARKRGNTYKDVPKQKSSSDPACEPVAINFPFYNKIHQLSGNCLALHHIRPHTHLLTALRLAHCLAPRCSPTWFGLLVIRILV